LCLSKGRLSIEKEFNQTLRYSYEKTLCGFSMKTQNLISGKK
jgi:hypothetical protein